MTKYIAIAPLVVNGNSYSPGDRVSGADADAVADSPLLAARCVPDQTPDPQPAKPRQDSEVKN